MYGFPFICFIGAAVRMLFYRIIGRKNVTMKYLTGKEDEQQITSIVFGFLSIFLFAFIVLKLL
jgi:hypothetical protein